ncbi:MAG: tRNA 2-thiouridine(34) synthase MnmA [Mycoplasmataceae bacterium]|nr:tRNA 2-thiouridine(34) synthase MnmA [Mycoplasmataceae bacterium]
MSKIVVGMSGGVDSAVTAHILKKQGHEVIGVFMRNWDSSANNDILGNPNKDAEICPEEMDWEDVKILSKQLDIDVQRVDFVKEYWDNVFKDLIEQYKSGNTPNPDVLCNRYVKFGAFHQWVKDNIQNVDFIATGHYADVEDGVLKKPHDAWKDQTYFLAQVKKDDLKMALFPLAKLPKIEVRKIAEDNNLIVANKKDSTGICFIGERDFTKFLQNYIPAQPGDIINIVTKETIGKHIGAMYYTIGQRKGLHLGGQEEPFYVAGHDLAKKVIYVAPSSNKSYLMSDEAIIKDVNWLINERLESKELEVKFRYKSKSVKCSIKWIDDKTLKVIYPEGFEAVTPGQQAVFYNGNYCIGGGTIENIYLNKIKKSFL